MTKEELKAHCEKTIEQCEMWAKYRNETPSGKVYEEHKLILELIEQSNSDEPMQVELEADGYSDGELVYDYGKCPKCGWEFEDGDKDWEEPYCCHCGQKLKWFEEGV